MPAETITETYYFVQDANGNCTSIPSSQLSLNREQSVKRRARRGAGSKSSYQVSDSIKEPFLLSLRWLENASTNQEAFNRDVELNTSLSNATRLVRCMNVGGILDSSSSAITDADGKPLFESRGMSVEVFGFTLFNPMEAVEKSVTTRFVSVEFQSVYGSPIQGNSRSLRAYNSYPTTS